MGRQSKLTLILGVLLLIGALVALPRVVFIMLRSQMTGMEGSSMICLRTINRAETVYAETYPKVGFSPTLRSLGDLDCHELSPQCAGLLDSSLASGVKSGYRYTYVPAPVAKGRPVTAYTVHADPLPEFVRAQPDSLLGRILGIKKEESYVRHFFTDQTRVICIEVGKEAGPHSPCRVF